MPMRNLTVLQAKRLGVYTISPDADLSSTARKMQDQNVSALVVTDSEGYLVGVISRTDLVRACLEQPDWSLLRVRDCMSIDVVTVELHDPMLRVMELLVDIPCLFQLLVDFGKLDFGRKLYLRYHYNKRNQDYFQTYHQHISDSELVE